MTESLLEQVSERLGERLLDRQASFGDATVVVAAEGIVEVLTLLRDDPELRFNLLVDLTAVDYLTRKPRFEIVYHLASLETVPRGREPTRIRHRLRIKVRVSEDPCEIPSCVEVWPAADWMEREVWDLYGIRFEGHPDLRRILLYDEFEGQPLRKDYPKERRQPLVGPGN